MQINFSHLSNNALVICEIMSFLDLNSLRNFSLCNKRLSNLFKNDQVWKDKLKNQNYFKCLILDHLDEQVLKGQRFQKMKNYMQLSKKEDDESVLDLFMLIFCNQDQEEVLWETLEQVLPVYREENSSFFKAVKNNKVFKFELISQNNLINKKVPFVFGNKGYKTYLNSTIFKFNFNNEKLEFPLNTSLFLNEKYFISIDKNMISPTIFHKPSLDNQFSVNLEKQDFHDPIHQNVHEERIQLMDKDDLETNWISIEIDDQKFFHKELSDRLSEGYFVAEIDHRPSSLRNSLNFCLSGTVDYHLDLFDKYPILIDRKNEKLASLRKKKSK